MCFVHSILLHILLSTLRERRHSVMSVLGSVYLLLFASAVVSAALVKRQDTESAVVYKQFLVDSLIVSRYAVTTITSVVRNNDPEQSRELQFLVQLPETAFISNFSM